MIRVTVISLLLAFCAGCAIVPQNRRAHLADPTMQAVVDPLDAKTKRKKHTSREAAAGGDGQPAGGGCGCGN